MTPSLAVEYEGGLVTVDLAADGVLLLGSISQTYEFPR
jgi:hypothetical protein